MPHLGRLVYRRLFHGRQTQKGWTFYYAQSQRLGFMGLLERVATRLLTPKPKVKRVSKQVPERLDVVAWPVGVQALGTYVRGRSHVRQLQDDDVLFRYRWPGMDAHTAAEEVGRLLAQAGFAPDFAAFSGPGGFAVRSNAFCWDETRTRRVYISSQPGIIDLNLYSGRDEPSLSALPTLVPPENVELVHAGGYPQEVAFGSVHSAQAVLDFWCAQIIAQGWQEVGRLVQEWGAFVQFRWPASGRVLTLSLSQTQPGRWWAQLNAAACTAADFPPGQG